MLLLILARLWVLVSEDEVYLYCSMNKKILIRAIISAYFVRSSAFIGAKHDNIRRCVGEFFGV